MKADLDTLGITGDGDDVELLEAAERAFGIRFGDRPEHWFTVGDMFTGVLDLLPPAQQAGACASAMAFYRLRRVLAPGTRIGPSAPLKLLLTASPKHAKRRIEQKTGLALPHTVVTAVGWAGLCLFALALAIAFCAGTLGMPRLLALPLTIAGGVLIHYDPHRFAQTTLGDLARDTADINTAHFIKQGADGRKPALWKALTQIIQQETCLPAEKITPQMRLMR